MYNEERKMRFLAETRTSTCFGESVFRTTEAYEQEVGADLCEFQTEVLQSMINANFGFRERTIETVISFIRSYVAWCKEQDYSTGRGVFDLKPEISEKMRRMMVSSPMHLQNILNDAFVGVSEQTIDCLYRCYLWMIFAGMDDLEPLDVTVDEVDFLSMTIKHAGKSYDIYREAVPAFDIACTAKTFLYINPGYNKEKERTYRDRCEGTFLFRGIRSGKIKLTTIKSAVNQAFKAHGIETSLGKIRLSGLFYRSFELERMGKPANFDGYINERMNKTNSEYHSNYTKGKRENLIKRDIESDYGHWKSAFIR